MAAHQEATRNWWDTARFDYDLFISEFVMAECASGNTDAAERRLAAIQNLPELDISSKIAQIL
ncbi:MAG: hypothetical protein L3K52_13660 [Candidatus Thiothrix sulfatifontis]|nr:MAG: hypothetical protein L3K52_13660 [Candidatus Thiothrix sulfatifontis]